jgi:hypothetical protein
VAGRTLLPVRVPREATHTRPIYLLARRGVDAERCLPVPVSGCVLDRDLDLDIISRVHVLHGFADRVEHPYTSNRVGRGMFGFFRLDFLSLTPRRR